MTFLSSVRRIAFVGAAFLLGVGATGARAATFSVANTNDAGAGSLRQAITDANAAPDADTILFDSGVFASKQTIALTSGQLSISTPITINGPASSGAGVTISGNSANRVFYMSQGARATLRNLTIRDGAFSISATQYTYPTKTASGSVGGGIYNSGGSLLLESCTLTQNEAIVGSAIFSDTDLLGTTLTVRNCTISDNNSPFGFLGLEGTIFNNDGLTIIESSTITGNTASGGAISGVISYGDTTTRTEVQNSLIAGNTGSDVAPYLISGNNTNSFQSNGHNLIGTGTGTTQFTAIGDQTGVTEPKLALLTDNGGPTQTIALLADSPAINAGSTNLATDQRGILRPVGGADDIGAFEFVSPVPEVVSVSPQNASDAVGAKRTFTLSVRDGEGASDISEMWLMINTTLDWNGGATLVYFPSSGELYLRQGDSFGNPIKIGAAAGASDVLDNGALRIVGSEVSVVVGADGTTLTLSVPATIRNGLVGKNRLFGRVQDVAGAVDKDALASDFGFVRVGSYTVKPQFAGTTNRIPTLSALSPKAANTVIPTTGVKLQTFVFYAKDEDGIGDLNLLWFSAGKVRDGANGATFLFVPRTRRLYLRSDDGQSFLGGGVVGSAGSIENSQVKVDLSQVQYLIYGDGKSVGLRLALQPKLGLLGQNKIWLRVQDNAGATSTGGDRAGFVQSGTWNVTQQSSNVNAADPSAPGS